MINNNSQNDTAEYLKMSFEVSFDILKNSITVIMKDSNDILQFWFAFLSVIMIVFTLIGFFVSSNILNQAREQLRMVEKEATNSIEKIKIEAESETEETERLGKELEDKYNNAVEGINKTGEKESKKLTEESDLFNKGLQAYNNTDYQSAIYYFTEVIELNLKNSMAYYNRGLAKYNLKEYEGSIIDYNKSIEINPRNSYSYYARGLSEVLLGKNEEALKDFETAYNLADNELKKDLINRIIILARQNKEVAIKFCEEHNINYKDNDNKE